jgi:hypothetical protein
MDLISFRKTYFTTYHECEFFSRIKTVLKEIVFRDLKFNEMKIGEINFKFFRSLF